MSRAFSVIEEKGVDEASERVHISIQSEQGQFDNFTVSFAEFEPLLFFDQRAHKLQVLLRLSSLDKLEYSLSLVYFITLRDNELPCLREVLVKNSIDTSKRVSKARERLSEEELKNSVQT